LRSSTDLAVTVHALTSASAHIIDADDDDAGTTTPLATIRGIQVVILEVVVGLLVFVKVTAHDLNPHRRTPFSLITTWRPDQPNEQSEPFRSLRH